MITYDPKQDITSSTLPVISPELDKLVLFNQFDDFTLELSSVSIVDSSGIGLLIRINSELKGRGHSLFLVNVDREIAIMLKMMRLDKHFSISEKERT
jgi:anti-sigma B factor antagonist